MCFSLQNVLYYLCKFPQMTSTPSPLLKNPETVIMEIMCHFKSSTASQDSQSFVSVCARQAASFKFGHTRESAGTFVMSQIILVGPPLEISRHREKSSSADECANSFQVSNAAHTSLYTVKLKYPTAGTRRKHIFAWRGTLRHSWKTSDDWILICFRQEAMGDVKVRQHDGVVPCDSKTFGAREWSSKSLILSDWNQNPVLTVFVLQRWKIFRYQTAVL